MRRLVLISFFIACLGTVCAQNTVQTKAIMDKVAAKIANAKGATARFAIISKKLGNTQGGISIKGNKFTITTPQAVVWFNGNTQWTYMKATNEVTVQHPSQNKLSQLNPYSFIYLYRKGYNMSMKRVGNSYQVHLVAKNASQSAKEFYLTVNVRNYTLSKIKMKQGGEWTTISISAFQIKNLSDAYFSFNSKDYPSAEIVDLR